MAKERYRAQGPDGAISFSIDSTDQTPLIMAARAALARKLNVPVEMVTATFTQIVPLNTAAEEVMSKPR